MYGSRGSQILELGVSEFWQLFPTHMLSLEFVLGFCHGIAKGETIRLNLFNHLLALFRANLFVIQHLETLYLGGNHIRVVCERV